MFNHTVITMLGCPDCPPGVLVGENVKSDKIYVATFLTDVAVDLDSASHYTARCSFCGITHPALDIIGVERVWQECDARYLVSIQWRLKQDETPREELDCPVI